MALDENKLKQSLADNYNNITNNKLSLKDSADGMAKAIVDYAKEAEVIINAPPLIPATTPVPDTSVVGQKAKVTTATAYESALATAILGSYKAMNSGADTKMILITATIILYAATFLTYKVGGASVVGATIMSVPPVLVPALKKGQDGASVEDVAAEMAKIINSSFTAASFTGVVTNSSTGATIPGAVAGILQ